MFLKVVYATSVVTTRILQQNGKTMLYSSCAAFSKYQNENYYLPILATKLNKVLEPNSQLVRNYAKGKDKKKEKGKSKVIINDTQLSEFLNVATLRTQMEKAIDALKDDFIKHLSLRSTTGSVEKIIVNVDGKDHTLQDLAQIIRKNPKMLVVNMAVFPQAIPAALKAIAKSGLNINPQQDGTTLYIPVPKVTKEHRESLAKNAKALFVKCKDSIRDAQLQQAKALKKKPGISEDILHSIEQQIVSLADTYITEAQNILDSKQNELLGIN